MISVVQLGRVDYATGLELQKSMVELRHQRRISNLLLLLEHAPVITLGRNANRANILASAARLEREGVEVFETDRGGDVTYHGPGQLVGYPIFDLRSFPGPDGQLPEGERKTIGAVDYVRRLEEVLIRVCADFGVPAGRIPKLTGVWTEPVARPQETEGGPHLPDARESGGPHLPAVGKCGSTTTVRSDAEGEPAKIAAIGVHISRGITSHGFALNVSTNLDHFQLIVPCGIATKPVTSLSKQTGAEVSLDRVAEAVARNTGRVFNSQVLWVDTLDALVGRKVGVPMRPPRELRALHDEDTWRA